MTKFLLLFFHLNGQLRWCVTHYGMNTHFRDSPKLKSLSCRLDVIHCVFPGGSDDKASACNPGNPGSIPGLERFPGERNGYPLQCSCLQNSMEEEPGWL